MILAKAQYIYNATLTGDELAILTVALCLILASAGWWLITEPTKHVRNTHSAAKKRTVKKKPAKRKTKKK